MPIDNVDEELRKQAAEYLWMHGGWGEDEALDKKLRFIVKGDGIRVTDSEGKTYIDGLSGMYVLQVGHGRKEIAEAVYDQMMEISYSAAYSSTMIPTVKLAAKVAQLAPPGLSKVHFTNGGAESVEVAMKVARQYQQIAGFPRKHKFISRRGSYHGNTFGTMSISHSQGYRHELYEPLLSGCIQIPQPYHYRCEYCQDLPQCNLECARSLERAILAEGPDTVAAFISEPISVSVGVAVPPPDYWPMVRETCDKYNVLLILDEIITGFGRTGKMFASEHWGVIPDMMTVAKGLSSGYLPRGAVVVKKDVAEAFTEGNKFPHGVTFASHPVACAAALANLEIIERENLVENSARMGQYLQEKLQPLYEHAAVGDIRGMGLLAGIELVKDKGTKERFSREIGPKFNELALQKGLRVKVGNVIGLAPPLIVTREDIDEIVGIVKEVITEIEKDQNLL